MRNSSHRYTCATVLFTHWKTEQGYGNMSKPSKRKKERKGKKEKKQSWPRRVPAGARFSRSCNPADRSSLGQQPRAALPAADRGEDGITWQQFENPNHLLDEKKSFKDAIFFFFFF